MSYATGTTHYNLPQTVGTDKRDWTDTNQAFSDVDTALYGAVQDAETATSGIQTLNAAVEVINGKLATDEGNISTLSGKVSTLESTVAGHTTAIADVRQDLQDNIESHTEASATSTHAYEIGDTFFYNDVLYKATAQIAIGGTIVPSTNCTAVTVMSEVNELDDTVADIDTEVTNLKTVSTITFTPGTDPAIEANYSKIFKYGNMLIAQIAVSVSTFSGSVTVATVGNNYYPTFDVSQQGTKDSVISMDKNQGAIKISAPSSGGYVYGQIVWLLG